MRVTPLMQASYNEDLGGHTQDGGTVRAPRHRGHHGYEDGLEYEEYDDATDY